ncbi:hypothetical protein NLU13_7897 [Sarocladium strictum]|uniref:CST complex subunit Stn1 N-terminal domain-containing protein n=1 Tax=Sarocladium strictum TaxID=5046 RepID=A0AA39GE83_SARSR|nr:hypothetical protein NLU13_7897 [Sarocladium strictum]
MGINEKATLYPRYCFHLSPTWPVWCFFKAAEIHALDKHDGFEGEQFFFYNNLPIKWVRIVGLVVAIDDFAGRRVFTIDDSSGACIEVLETLTASPRPEKNAQAGTAGNTGDAATVPHTAKVSAYPDIDVGHVVEIKGGLSEFRDEKQITVEKLLLVRSTMEEVILWEKRTKFRKEILEKPWVLDSRELRKAQKEADKDKARAAKKRVRASEREHSKASQQKGGIGSASQPVNLRELLRGSKGKFGALGL